MSASGEPDEAGDRPPNDDLDDHLHPGDPGARTGPTVIPSGGELITVQVGAADLARLDELATKRALSREQLLCAMIDEVLALEALRGGFGVGQAARNGPGPVPAPPRPRRARHRRLRRARD